MLHIKKDLIRLVGPEGFLTVHPDDEITLKLAMLYEGVCEGVGATRAARKLGYSRQRYFQLLHAFEQGGAIALKPKKTGPRRAYRRTDEVIRLVIRHRFLDPDASAEVIAQRLRQCGWQISTRSVTRIITEFGLQKKTPRLSSPYYPSVCGDPSHQEQAPTGTGRPAQYRAGSPAAAGRQNLRYHGGGMVVAGRTSTAGHLGLALWVDGAGL